MLKDLSGPRDVDSAVGLPLWRECSQGEREYKGLDGQYHSISQLLKHLAVVDLH